MISKCAQSVAAPVVPVRFQGVCLVADSGGTNTRFNLLDDASDQLLLETVKLPTPSQGPGFVKQIAAVLRDLKTQLASVAPERVVDYAALAVAGPVNIHSGEVIGTNTKAYTVENMPFAKAVKLETDLPTVLVNDADAFVLGEVLSPRGALFGKQNALGITLGTGIGGGAVIDGKLFTIGGRSVMEVGHIVIDKDGRQVSPPRTQGCWESYASGRGLLESGRQALKAALLNPSETGSGGLSPEELSNSDIFNAAEKKAPWAVAVLEAWHQDVAAGLASVINTLGLMDVVIGGGLSARVDYERLSELVKPRLIYPESVKATLNIVPSLLGDDAALIGAAHLGQQVRETA